MVGHRHFGYLDHGGGACLTPGTFAGVPGSGQHGQQEDERSGNFWGINEASQERHWQHKPTCRWLFHPVFQVVKILIRAALLMLVRSHIIPPDCQEADA
jgi:hypothetical protein